MKSDGQRGPTDAVIRRLAARQHGVVERTQLLSAGITRDSIDYRLRSGRLERILRGVYRVGPLPSELERETAAILAGGRSAVLTHRTAAVLWGLLPRSRPEPPIDLNIRDGHRRLHRNIRVRSIDLTDAEISARHGLPLTTPIRTIFDLASVVDPDALEAALIRGARLHHLRPAALRGMADRNTGRPGIRALRRALGREATVPRTRSEAELVFLARIRSAGLAEPRANARLQGYEVDMLWKKQRLVVEIDGFGFHASTREFERDRRKDAVLVAAGYTVMRITWRQMTREPDRVVTRVAQALARRTR